MLLNSLELSNFRNYESLNINFDKGTNILYGDNAQGKTNILEGIYVSATTRSHKGSKDSELVRFGYEEAHIRTCLEDDGVPTRVDMHIRKSRTKGIAIDGQKIKRAAELMGILTVVFFSPEDLSIIKDSPAVRRRFVDMELCQLDSMYLQNLSRYNRTLNQRNKLLKDIYSNPYLKDTLDVWDDELIKYGTEIISRRSRFIGQLNEIIHEIHSNLSGKRENLIIEYIPGTDVDNYRSRMKASLDKDMRYKSTNEGPHRDDIIFTVGRNDIRKYGSQGQQRTAALSLKLSEIELVKKITNKVPLLLLDDVLSELDSNRQNYLLNSIGDIQTIITCTGLDEFVKNRFEINRVYHISDGRIAE